MGASQIRTTCCIAGGGPAGIMLGFLLARAGVQVTVLEKHKDFLRDFRGDTVHPSTLEMMYELGLLDEFLKLPHSQVEEIAMQIGADRVVIGGFDRLPVHCKFVALMPQWNFLNFLVAHGKRYKTFDLRMSTEAIDLFEENGKIVGLRAKAPDGALDIRAYLVVGCDGRHSTLRERAGFKVDNLGAPMDVLWFRLPRKDSDSDDLIGHVEAGRMIVMINRNDYWQCAYLIPKGGIDKVRSAGLPAFRQAVAEMSPFVRGRVDEIKDWDDVKLLSVAVDRLQQWYRPGLLCIG
ncbi:MAG: FAD-dependent oxidoreductase, partial [Pseudolabrys sp.]